MDSDKNNIIKLGFWWSKDEPDLPMPNFKHYTN